MKSVCITGASDPELKAVCNIFQRAGMLSALPPQGDEPLDITSWHRRVIAGAAEGAVGPLAIAHPGRLWEQLAGDIFVANLKSPLWGWTDSFSTWLLDFWLGFEPNLNFVLVCVSPEQMLARSISDTAEEVSAESAAMAWQWYHQEMLRFHHRHPDRSILVEAADFLANPKAAIKEVSKRWNLPLRFFSSEYQQYSMEPLAQFLGRQFLGDFTRIGGLRQEIAATVTRVGSLTPVDQAPGPMAKQIVASYRLLKDRSEKLIQAEGFRADLEHLQHRHGKAQHKIEELDQARRILAGENAALLREKNELAERCEALLGEVAALTQERARQEQLAAEQRDQVEALTRARDEQTGLAADRQAQIETSQAKCKEAEQENELLLLQLHQVQEELEHYFLQHQETQKQLEQANGRLGELDDLTRSNQALSAEKATLADEKAALSHQCEALQAQAAALAQDRDAQAVLVHDRQTQIAHLTAERDQHAHVANERHNQIEALSRSNHALGEERSLLANEKAALSHQCEALQAQAATLTQERDAQALVAQERQAQIETSQAKTKEAEQENELLLLQLHQVQEELEHYFLKQQETQQRLENAEARWQRMLQRNPSYCDFESIEVLPAEKEGDGSNAIAWRLLGLNIAGGSLPSVEFKTIVEHGIAGFAFHRSADGHSPLLRWPAAAVDQAELLLIPVGTEASASYRLECLRDVAARDWDLLQGLVKILKDSLADPGKLNAPADWKREVLKAGLENLSRLLARYSFGLRYDRVTLRHNQSNPDYENLCLRLEGVSLGSQRWAQFDFRLSCAHVRPDRFGSHPKLEFSEEGGQVPFDAWFIESHDDFGAKMELRFALPEAMDIAVWQRMSEHDRAFVTALIARLPSMLTHLQTAGVQIKRPWNEWIDMARELQRITTVHNRPPAPQAGAQAAADKGHATAGQQPRQAVAKSQRQAASKPKGKRTAPRATRMVGSLQARAE